MKFISIAALLVLALTALAVPAGTRYSFSLAGEFPKSNYTTALGLGFDNEIVGYYSVGSALRAYTQKGSSFTDIAPPGSVDSFAFGATNRFGATVGGFCPFFCNVQSGTHGFILLDGKYTQLDFPGGPGTATVAYGINDVGQVVGGYCPDIAACPEGPFNPPLVGFIYDHGKYTKFAFPGALESGAYAINNAGEIVGLEVTDNITHAFFYSHGAFRLIDVPGQTETAPRAINNLGVIAGFYTSETGCHGFTLDSHTLTMPSGPVFNTIDYPGSFCTALDGLNDRGVIAGIEAPPAGGFSPPFIGIPFPSEGGPQQ